MLRGILTVGGWTLISRILGFARDMLIAALIGTGSIADAFFVALKLPNLFRRLFGEGAFNAAFIPAFSGLLHTEGSGAAKQFAQETFAVMAFWLGIMTILGEIFMPELMVVLAPGFAEDRGKFALAISLSRITFPYLVLICLAALVSGVLNGLERFTAASASYVLFNIVSIACMLWMTPYVPTVGHALSPRRHVAQDTPATVNSADAAANAPDGARSARGGSYAAKPNRRCDHSEPSAGWHCFGAIFCGSGTAVAAWGDWNRCWNGAPAFAVAASSSRGGSVSHRNAEPRY
jgi:Lipid II flippase MurJ